MSVDKVFVVKAEEWHIDPIARDMRNDDMQEIFAARLFSPHEALTRGFLDSTKCYTGMYDGNPVVMFGVTPAKDVLYNYGYVWLLGTTELDKYQISFLRYCQRYMPDLQDGFDFLVNYVDSRNRKTIRWLRWLGFDIMEPVNIGMFQLPFHRFERRAS